MAKKRDYLPKVEEMKHLEAFECYYRLGPARNHTTVAKKVGVSRDTISRWARAFNWNERIIEKDGIRKDILSEVSMDSVIEQELKIRKILEGLIDNFTDNFNAGLVNVTNVYEFTHLVKTYLLLTGGSTSNVQIQGQVNTTNENNIQIDFKDEPRAKELLTELFRLRHGETETEEGMGEISKN